MPKLTVTTTAQYGNATFTWTAEREMSPAGSHFKRSFDNLTAEAVANVRRSLLFATGVPEDPPAAAASPADPDPEQLEQYLTRTLRPGRIVPDVCLEAALDYVRPFSQVRMYVGADNYMLFLKQLDGQWIQIGSNGVFFRGHGVPRTAAEMNELGTRRAKFRRIVTPTGEDLWDPEDAETTSITPPAPAPTGGRAGILRAVTRLFGRDH